MIVTDVKIKSPATDREKSLHLKMDLKSERASISESVLGSQTEIKTFKKSGLKTFTFLWN